MENQAWYGHAALVSCDKNYVILSHGNRYGGDVIYVYNSCALDLDVLSKNIKRALKEYPDRDLRCLYYSEASHFWEPPCFAANFTTTDEYLKMIQAAKMIEILDK